MKIKKIIAILLVVVCLSNCFSLFSLALDEDEAKASGLILEFNLKVSKKNSTTLQIDGFTICDPIVVKCGFKSLKVQRKLNSSSSWSDYYDYGNDYVNTWAYTILKELSVDPGYQYRVTCKHYAKKNILNTQTISNTSNIVTF